MPRPLYPREKHSTHCTGGWVGPRAGLDGGTECLALTGIPSPDRPACSESLYRLSYPAPLLYIIFIYFIYFLLSSSYIRHSWSSILVVVKLSKRFDAWEP